MMKHDSGAYCYRVKGLFVPYTTPITIDRDINTYIDNIAKYTETLDTCFHDNRLTEFISCLEKIRTMLIAVYAKHCEACVTALLHSANTHGLGHSRQLLQQTIADFLLLSIEMQKEQKIGISNAPKYTKIEKTEEIVRSLSIIGKLFQIKNYTKAKDIIHEMKDMDPVFGQLSLLLDSHDYRKAEEIAKSKEQEQINIISKRDTGTNKAMKLVLAVDDRAEILTSVINALRGHYKVLGAPSGMNALQIMSQKNIDLFYLDIHMPEMDGFEVARHIRAMDAYKKTPILFLTGNSSRENISRAISIGANDFIVKPASDVTLLAKVRRYMDQS